MRRATLLLVLASTLMSCQSRPEQTATPAPSAVEKGTSSQPPLPDDEAGRLVRRAIAAAGGWETWLNHRDVAYIATLTIFDPLGNAVSESIFLHKMLLHQGMKVRLESIGLGEEVLFGFDGQNEWMLRDGRAVTASVCTAFTRFHALSSAYWFSLPFVLAELPCELTYLGSEKDGETTVEKIRVGYADSVPVPFDWVILYFDASTAKLERIHVHALASFLQHSLWLGVLRGDRQVGGISVERRRAFFPADAAGEIVGAMAAETLLEHVEFDRGFAPDLFAPPEKVRGLTAEIES